MSTLQYRFLPWMRKGAANYITTPDDSERDISAHYTSNAAIEIDVIHSEKNEIKTEPVNVSVNLYGPADVAAIEKQQIVRREPAPQMIGFEPNYFPSIEFREPDFPWRYTPTAPWTDSKLRPWMVLIVLKKSEGTVLRQIGRARLPVVAAPLYELPDLRESSLWAHVQVSGPFPSEWGNTVDENLLRDYIIQNPNRAVSRIISFRRLAPTTNYLVCLVPAFEVGRLTGLGEDDKRAEIKLKPAWDKNDENTEPVKLPVYDFWEFATAEKGDFESVVRAITPLLFRKICKNRNSLLILFYITIVQMKQ